MTDTHYSRLRGPLFVSALRLGKCSARSGYQSKVAIDGSPKFRKITRSPFEGQTIMPSSYLGLASPQLRLRQQREVDRTGYIGIKVQASLYYTSLKRPWGLTV